MKPGQLFTIVVISILPVLSTGVAAAQDQHKGHDGPYYGVSQGEQDKQALEKLERMPPSGRAREAYSDGRYLMEPTTVKNDLATKCAQGSRGIVMLDNDTWKQCGGKPEGAAKGAGHYPAIPPWNKEGKGKATEMDHSMH